MTDWGFIEILMILMVGLLIFGPDKLPEALRTGYRLYAKLSKMFQDVRLDVERELHTQEITTAFETEREKLEALDSSLRSQHLDLVNSFDRDN